MADKITPKAKQALNALNAFLDEKADGAETAKAAVDQYNKLKGTLGSSAIASKLGLKEVELPFFESAVRDAGRRLDVAKNADGTILRNASIAAFRFLSWVETLRSNGADIQMPDGIDAIINEDMGRKQIRALELIIRSLIDERFGSQESLESQLKSLFNPAVVDKWKQTGDAGDLLSGATFSELSSLFINKQEYPNYEKLYGETAFLNYLRDRRKTIQSFLDDIRRVRNTLAHNKVVTNTQLSLLALYYEELIAPIQDAYDEGETKVNPSIYIDVSKEDLDAYFSDLREDIEGVKDDIADFRASVEGALGLISEDTKELKQTAEKVKSRTGLIAAGIVVLLVGVGALYFITSGTKEDTSQIKQDTANIKETTERTEKNVSEIKTSLLDMAEGLKALAQTGGLVSNPSNPAEYYHNARVLIQRGEVDRAITSFEGLFTYDFINADPIIDLVSILRQKYGEEGLLGAIDAFIPPSKEVQNKYAKLLVKEPSSKDMEFWLSKKPLFLPAVPEIVKYSENQPFNRARYLLQTELEKAFMNSSDDRTRYYIDPIRADVDYQKVKVSYEATDWSYFKNLAKSPLFFFTEGYPGHGVVGEPNLSGAVKLVPWMLDEVGPQGDGKYQIRINASGEFNKLVSGYKFDSASWNNFKNHESFFEAKKIYGLFKTVFYRDGLLPENVPLFPFVSDIKDERKDAHICATWLHQGNITFDVRWIDNEGVERLVENINLCPPIKKQPSLLFFKQVENDNKQNDKKEIVLKLNSLIPVYQPGAIRNFIRRIEVQDAESGSIIAQNGKGVSEIDIDATEMSGLWQCMTKLACERIGYFQGMKLKFKSSSNPVIVKFFISHFSSSEDASSLTRMENETLMTSAIVQIR